MMFSPLRPGLFPDLVASELEEAGEEGVEGGKGVSFVATSGVV